jgi:uncharacterized membrane protein YfcA
MKLKDRIAKLIDVKSIVTFALTGTFVFLSVQGKIEPQIFMSIYTMIMGFYFGSNVERHKGENNERNR